jgi:hypothetical protein
LFQDGAALEHSTIKLTLDACFTIPQLANGHTRPTFDTHTRHEHIQKGGFRGVAEWRSRPALSFRKFIGNFAP